MDRQAPATSPSLMRWALCIVALCGWNLACYDWNPASPWGATTDTESVKVFILAGQSNMVGKGLLSPDQAHIDKNGGMGTLEYLLADPTHAPHFGHLASADATWIERDDVWLADLDSSGPLTAGGKDTFGPELEFGFVMGDYYENPVLIIKTAWGGKSLYTDFRPPSAGGEVGPYYTLMVERVYEVLEDIALHVPGYRGQGYEIAGFGWHQGWNDRIDQTANDAYQANLVHLINDLRNELDVPQMPFVLATTGMSGWAETHPRALSLMEAQLAAPTDGGLRHRGDVWAVETRDFFRLADDSPAGVNQGFHWHWNAETFFLIGRGMAEAMIMLRGDGMGLADACPADDTKFFAGKCGCGAGERDSDNDGTPDCLDGCPNDPLATEPCS